MTNRLAPLPLSDLPGHGIEGLFTDLDDTLTTDGQLSVEAFSALTALAEAGIRVVPVTGRSAGWCDLIARLWPVAAVIGETGAFCMIREGGQVRTLMMQGEQAQQATSTHRNRIARRVLEEVPDARLAGDQAFRLVDLAIDIAEAIPRLAPPQIDRIVAILREEGMQAQPSSIHVNGWFGEFDKGRAALRLLTEHWGMTPEAAATRWACVGDAPNDATLFASFRHSVGVANVARHLGRIACPPRYITEKASGAGFAELARHLLSSRAG
jgi:HAD superfamily hydrolase (TIGR01484 family)